MTVDLFPHQVEAVGAMLHAIEHTGGGYLAHQVGTGKTLTAILTAQMRAARRVLVVTGPLSATTTWGYQLAKWWPDAGERVRVVNVAKLIPRKQEGKKSAVDPPLLKELLRWGPDLFIFDESQYLARFSAQTRTAWKLRNASGAVLLLSGTPVHDPLGYWTQYRMIDPTHPLWAQEYRAYKQGAAYWGGPDGNWIDKRLGDQGFRPEALAEIAAAIAPWTHRFDSRDLHLPEPLWTEVPFELYPEEHAAYLQMHEEFYADVGDWHTAAQTALVKLLRLHQLASGHATEWRGANDDGEPVWGDDRWSPRSAKLDTLTELLQQRTHLKVIVACKHISEIDAVLDRALQFWPGDTLKDKGRVFHNPNVAHIDGRWREDKRAEFMARFRDATEPQLIVIQPRSGGISTNDLVVADCLINYSMEPSNIVWQQLIGRVYRTGQTTHVQIMTLLAEHTVDEPLYQALRQNMERNDLIAYVAAQLAGGDHHAEPV